VISPETKVLLARRPTENAEAYDDYVKARQIRQNVGFGGFDEAESLLSKAVQLDPKFAAAWGELGAKRAFDHFNRFATAEKIGLAKAAIDTAVGLAPDDPHVIESEGDYYYYGYRDYSRAIEQYLRLAQMKPNDPAMYASMGLIHRRQGRYVEAIDNFRRSLELDPDNLNIVTALEQVLVYCRRYAETDALVQKVMARHPDNEELAWSDAYNRLMESGSTARIRDFAARTVDPSRQATFVYLQEQLAYYSGDWAEVVRIEKLQPHYDGDPDNAVWAQDTEVAEALAEMGDMPAAQAKARFALDQMQRELDAQPENAILWANLSLAHGIAGDKEETLRCAQRSSELMSEARDAIVGPSNSTLCAYAFMWAGDKERALSEIQRLLRVPWGTNVHMAGVSFRLLAGDPRFKALLADPANNAPLY
jgi:tetratricopeptide (TPR) repeat protein